MTSKQKNATPVVEDPLVDSEDEYRQDEEAFLAKYKLNGELPKKIPYSHDIFKPSAPMKWDDVKSFKERAEKQKDAGGY